MNENHASEIKIRYIIYGLYYNVTIMSTFFLRNSFTFRWFCSVLHVGQKP